jgi:hypothetical protein
MPDRLLVSVLGNRHTGKTTTWHTLFDASVNTGKHERKLYLNAAQWVKVFLVSGSPEERKMPIQTMLGGKLPQIVLCSTQYRATVKSTYDHFFGNDYEVFTQWLNPGHGEVTKYPDNLGLGTYLLDRGATLHVRDGRIDPSRRVKELRQFLLGWATHRGLVHTNFPK